MSPTIKAVTAARAAHTVMARNRRFLWQWLSVSLFCSVMGNVGNVWVESVRKANGYTGTVVTDPSFYLSAFWALVPPTLLMLAIHGLPVLQEMLAKMVNDRLLEVVVWGVTMAAFVWSGYGIILYSAEWVPLAVAFLAPVTIDLSVFGATRGLVKTATVAAQMALEAEALDAPTQPRPSRSPTRDIASPAGSVTESLQVTAGDSVTHRRTDAPSGAAPRQTDALRADVPTHTDSALTDAPTHTDSALTDAPMRVDALPEAFTESFIDAAHRVIDAGGTDKPAETVASVLALHAQDVSAREIAKRVTVTAGTAGKIIRAAEGSQNQLTSVG
jgi:hypothetical protein